MRVMRAGEGLVRAGRCEEITRGAKAVMLTAVPKALRAQMLFPRVRGPSIWASDIGGSRDSPGVRCLNLCLLPTKRPGHFAVPRPDRRVWLMKRTLS